MEIANQWTAVGSGVSGLRQATTADAGQITRMLREAPYTHLHADWHYPAEWLDSDFFMLIEGPPPPAAQRPSLAQRLFEPPAPLWACLAIAPDPPPAAWVRVGAVARPSLVRQHLAALLAAMTPSLRVAGVNEIGWLVVEEWPSAWFTDLGFEMVNAVATYVRQGAGAPQMETQAGLLIRPVAEADLPLLEAIEARAFEPLWRHSAAGLALAAGQSISFDVAELDGRVAGFQFSTPTRRGVHLSRMTVDPNFQRRGVGSALLAHALTDYERQGMGMVTLNTQVDNLASQRLYERFGFQPNGERFPVWAARI